MSGKASDSEERLNSCPVPKKGLLSLSEITDDRSGGYDGADNAEEK